jgi:hypothetical protein
MIGTTWDSLIIYCSYDISKYYLSSRHDYGSYCRSAARGRKENPTRGAALLFGRFLLRFPGARPELVWGALNL